jgi:hypothetical protein
MEHLDKSPRQLDHCEDLFEKRLVAEIEQKGWSIVHQAGSCYTVGLWRTARHPELIVFGLPAERAQLLLEQAAAEVASGMILCNPVEGLTQDYPLQIHPVLPGYHKEYLAYNRWYYRGDGFHAAQLVWPDPDRRFFDHPDYPSHLHQIQPQLCFQTSFQLPA